MLIIFSSCSSTLNNINANDIDFLVEQGNAYWLERQTPEKAKLSNSYFARAVEMETSSLVLSAQFLQSSYYLAHYIETNPTNKDSIFHRAATYAIKLIHNSEEYIINDVSTAKSEIKTEQLTIKNLDENYVPILYWWIANLGRYLIDKPISERLNYSEVIQTGLGRLIELDPNYYYGGPYRLLGTFYVRVPGFDVDIAKSYFQKSYDSYPNCFSTSVLMAQYCCTKSNNRKHFHELLENVVNSNPNAIPQIGPENMHEQKFAQELLKMEFFLFE
jgi:hypothetical protein